MPEEITFFHINLSSDEKLVQTPPEQQSQVVAPCRLHPSGRHVRMHFECNADEGANLRWQQEKEEVKEKLFLLLVRMSLSNLYHRPGCSLWTDGEPSTCQLNHQDSLELYTPIYNQQQTDQRETSSQVPFCRRAFISSSIAALQPAWDMASETDWRIEKEDN